ncbi:MAG: OFA family MFS transporter, partial [Alphaproteobacteria bacterium]|nr:OFA family MFS transporter [Alphaproteobacteria bacterium]
MPDSKTLPNRWMVVLGAVLVQLALGSIYAWPVFTPALKAAGWSKLETQVVFSVGLATFALVMVWAGRRIGAWGPRKLALRGGLVLGLGYALAGLAGGTDFRVLTLCVGVIGGAGIGLAYVVPIAVAMRWFPDRKGMITGIAVAGFGFGALGWVKLADGWGHLIASFGLAGTFVIYGAAFAALVVAGSLWMVFPPGGWAPEGWTPPPRAVSAGPRDFTPAEMLRTPQFHLIFAAFAVAASAGLMAIGLMKLYPMEALQANGLSVAEASAVAGTAMAVFFSLANGVGRIAWGAISDRVGRRVAVLAMIGSQGLVFLSFTAMAGDPWTLYLGATLIGFNFGGNFALFPTITADTFGTDSVGRNYPWVFLSYGVGGIAGPVLGGLLGDLGDFPL